MIRWYFGSRRNVTNRPAEQGKEIVFKILVIAIAVGLVSGCGGGLSQQLYLRNNESALSQPASSEQSVIRFEVAPGTPARSIGQLLQSAGLINDATLFEAYVRVNGLSNQLAAGVFLLSPSMTIPEIAAALQSGVAASLRVTIPEGWRIGQILDHLRAQPAIEPEAVDVYEAQVSTGLLTEVSGADYPFLSTRPANTSLEGYLFPDTYQLAIEATGSGTGATNIQASMLKKQLDAFRDKVMPLYVEAAKSPDVMDLYTVLIIASIVEREAVIAEEKPAIAGVYLNRLSQGIKLEADPTVQYAMGYQPDRAQWWKSPVFLEEYSSVLSPYNTYLYPGLPPGPIANPGLGSIEAVLYPEEHNFIYFVALPGENGRHVFATTFAEHQENVNNYLSQ